MFQRNKNPSMVFAYFANRFRKSVLLSIYRIPFRAITVLVSDIVSRPCPSCLSRSYCSIDETCAPDFTSFKPQRRPSCHKCRQSHSHVKEVHSDQVKSLHAFLVITFTYPNGRRPNWYHSTCLDPSYRTVPNNAFFDRSVVAQ